MEVYNNVYKVTVESTTHGKKVSLIAAHTIEDVCSALATISAPWISDKDLSITLIRPSKDTLIVITDKAKGISE